MMTFLTLFVTSVVLLAGSTYQLDETVLDMFPDYNTLHKTVQQLQASFNQHIKTARGNWVKVGFSATRIKKQQSLKKGSTIRFERVWLDSHSSGYNGQTGVFKARLAGLYSFAATIMPAYENSRAPCGLAVNDQVRSKILGSNQHAQGVISAVVNLGVGDEVKIVMIEDGDVYGDDWSSFSGFLIQQ